MFKSRSATLLKRDLVTKKRLEKQKTDRSRLLSQSLKNELITILTLSIPLISKSCKGLYCSAFPPSCEVKCLKMGSKKHSVTLLSLFFCELSEGAASCGSFPMASDPWLLSPVLRRKTLQTREINMPGRSKCFKG